MSDDPCKKLKEEYEAALEEYLEADRIAGSFTSSNNVDQVDKMPLVSGNAMGEAYDRRDAAREKYDKAFIAYNECKKKLQQKS